MARQELEIDLGDEHISFTVSSIDLIKKDCQDWITSRCSKLQRSRRLARVLLLDSRSEMSSLFANLAAFQGNLG